MTISEKKKLRSYAQVLSKMSLTLNELLVKEEYRLDNLSERMSEGPKADELQDNIESLEEVASLTDELINLLEEF